MIPGNIADAASAIKDGELGLVEEVSIGDLVVSALTGMSFTRDLSITRKPVQAGYAITDAAVRQPIELVLEVCLANPDFSVEAGVTAALTGNVSQFVETWRDKRDKLEALHVNKTLLTVTTHEQAFSSMLVTSIHPHYDVNENYNAWFGTVICNEIIVGDEEADLDFTVNAPEVDLPL